jgi:DNA-directed RNA polymerase specialized sigma24 family protein
VRLLLFERVVTRFLRVARRTVKLLNSRLQKAQQQILALLEMTPLNVTEEEWAFADAELDADDIVALEAEYYEADYGRGLEALQNPLGRKLFRRGKLEFYREILNRVMSGMPRKQIAEELNVSLSTVKQALRTIRRLTNQDYTHHRHDADDFYRCPQCRGYASKDSRSEYNPLRKRKQKEIPISYFNLQGSSDQKLDYLLNNKRGLKKRRLATS